MRRVVSLIACLALAVSSAGCELAGRDERLTVAGRVRADVVTIGAPGLPLPVVDLRSAITSMTPVSRFPTAAPSPTETPAPRPSGRVERVAVREGESVRAGEVLVVMDRRAVDLQAALAGAGARRARAEADILRERAEELREKRADLRAKRTKPLEALATIADARRTLDEQIGRLPAAEAQLRAKERELLAQRAKLVATRSQLEAQERRLLAAIAQLEEVVGSLPPTLPPQPDDPREALARAEQALAQVQAGLAQVRTALPRIDAGLAQLRAGRDRIAVAKRRVPKAKQRLQAGASKARSGLARIDEGIETLGDAIDRLGDAAEITDAFSAAAEVSARTLRALRSLAVIRAPSDGTVLRVAARGSAVMVNAPLVVFRPEERRLIDTYLTRDQLRVVKVGTAARVRGDWSDESLSARVAVVDDEYGFPPTSFPTAETHLTRAFKVTLELEDTGANLPAGVPVDIVFEAAR